MQLLSEHTGSWRGTNRFRLMPDDPPVEAEMTAQLSLAADGHLAVLAYTWTHPDDGGQDGLLTIGADETDGEVVALWGDSWHQHPAAKTLHGTAGERSLTVGYSYAEGWEWRITVTADRPDVLQLRMDNVVPASATGTGEAAAYWAMDGELHRSA